MARYAAYFWLLRRASAFGGGFFCPLGHKRAYYAVLALLGHFWSSVVTLVAFSSNLNTFFLSNKSENFKKKIQKKLNVLKI